MTRLRSHKRHAILPVRFNELSEVLESSYTGKYIKRLILKWEKNKNRKPKKRGNISLYMYTKFFMNGDEPLIAIGPDFINSLI